MPRRWPVLLVWVLPFAGCLQGGAAPAGVHLFHGKHVESLGFIQVDDKPMVRFADRQTFATATLGGRFDLWISSFDGVSQRKIVTNQSDDWGEQGPYNAGDRYFMIDEHLVDNGAGAVKVASLLRLGPTLNEEFRLDSIVRYSRHMARS